MLTSERGRVITPRHLYFARGWSLERVQGQLLAFATEFPHQTGGLSMFILFFGDCPEMTPKIDQSPAESIIIFWMAWGISYDSPIYRVPT